MRRIGFSFQKVNRESWGVLAYAGVNVSELVVMLRMFIHFDVGMGVE